MKEDWNDPDFARWWDERADAKPLRAEQLGGRRHDHTATVATHLTLLRQAGFDAACVHTSRNRAVLTAVKPAAEGT